MDLLVPSDPRMPIMGFQDDKEADIVLFEDGTLGYVSEDKYAHLRGGSSYVPIYSKVTDIKSAPQYSESTIDTRSLVEEYYLMQIGMYALIAFIVLFPWWSATSWDNMLASRGIEILVTENYYLVLPAMLLAFLPETIVWYRIRGGSLAELHLDTGQHISICVFEKVRIASMDNKQVGWGTMLLMLVMLSGKLALPIVFLDTVFAIEWLFLCALGAPILVLWSYLESQRGAPDGYEKIPHSHSSDVHSYILEKWTSSSLHTLVAKKEGIALEFKSSLWYDYHKADPDNKRRYDPEYDPNLRKNKEERTADVVKAVAGFLNSDQSGKVLIGVGDRGTILGLDEDFELTRGDNPRDEFERKLDAALHSKLTSDADLHGRWGISWLGEESLVCMIDVDLSSLPVYVKVAGRQIYYQRTPSATKEIPPGPGLSRILLDKFPR